MGKIAFVFPGQGTQVVGMGRALYEVYPAATEIYDMCGETIKRLSFEGPQESLNQTIHAQPCLFAASMAAARVLAVQGIVPDGVAGFSLGEISALAFAELLHTKDAFDFVSFRAIVMEACAKTHKGGMAALLDMDAKAASAFCQSIEGTYLANFNAPGQVTVAFRDEVKDTFLKYTKASNVKAVLLAVSGAFHSPLMNDAVADINNYLKKINFKGAKMPLYSNVTGQLYGNDPVPLLAQQINHPVRWKTLVEQMIADGFDIFVETGPGKVLTGLIKRINKNVTVFNVSDVDSVKSTIDQIKF